MKKFTIILACALLTFTSMTSVKADLCSLYGVNISDANDHNDNVNLFQLFNTYFADELGDNVYSSSNDLFNDLGVNPFTDWATSGSQLVGGFKVAALGHVMSMVSPNPIDPLQNDVVAQLIDAQGTSNLGQGGITDLSGLRVINIADGLHVTFQLDAYSGSELVYSWSSNPENNDGSLGTPGDGLVHMIALDITGLYNTKYGTANDSVYMFGWEDLHLGAANSGLPADWDYQDFVAIMTNVKPNNNVTPEPATMLMFGMGMLALPVARRLRKK